MTTINKIADRSHRITIKSIGTFNKNQVYDPFFCQGNALRGK